MKKVCALLILMLCMVMMSNFLHAEANQANLVKNGDFEEDDGNGKPAFWTPDGWHMDDGSTSFSIGTNNPKSGTRYVTIENYKNNDARFIQTLRVEPETVYRISCWARAQIPVTDKIGAAIGVQTADYCCFSKYVSNTDNRWEYLEHKVRTLAGQSEMTVSARLGHYNNDLTGKVDFDDFRVEKITVADLTTVENIIDTTILNADKPNDGYVLLIVVSAVIILVLITILMLLFFLKKKPEPPSKTPKTIKPEDVVPEAPTPAPAPELKEKVTQEGEPKSVIYEQLPLRLDKKTKYTKLDFILMFGLTILYAIVAFYNLGSFKAPLTYWWPQMSNESFYVDLGSVKEVRNIKYYTGLPGYHQKGKFRLEASDDAVKWTHAVTIEPPSIFYWNFRDVNFKGRYIKIIAELTDAQLKEMAFYGDNATEPYKIEKVVSIESSLKSKGKPEHVVDEQNIIPKRPSFMTGMSPGFDEQYHARTAEEFRLSTEIYETTHPPLGKVIMMFGIMIFGMNPFGWRFAGTLVGVIMVLLMYMFGKKLFQKTEYAFMCAFLMSVDFMHFTQTRIATIDSYGVFFIILMYYFMYKYFSLDFYKTEFKKTLVPLLFSGIFWGMGISSKWISIGAGAGLAFLYFVVLIRRVSDHNDYKRRLADNDYVMPAEERKVIKFYTSNFSRHLIITLCWSFVVFIIIPLIIYLLSYIPFMLVPGPGHDIAGVIQNNIGMFNYHSGTFSKHPYSSPWYEWPLIWRPMYYYAEGFLPVGKVERIVALGNPAVWWIGSIAALITLGMVIGQTGKRLKNLGWGAAFKSLLKNWGLYLGAIASLIIINMIVRQVFSFGKENPIPVWLNFAYAIGLIVVCAIIFILSRVKPVPSTGIFRSYLLKITVEHRDRFFIITGFLFMYGFWLVSTRKETYIYHYFGSVPFIIFATVYLIKKFKEKLADNPNQDLLKIGNGIIYFYLLVALVLFIMFYPVIAGAVVDGKYVATFLKWLPRWDMFGQY